MLATGSNYTETVRLMLSHKADAYEANQVSMRERERESRYFYYFSAQSRCSISSSGHK